MHCVDLGESFSTSIYLQKSASIQPRTSPSKFGGKIQFNIHFTLTRCANSAGGVQPGGPRATEPALGKLDGDAAGAGGAAAGAGGAAAGTRGINCWW